MFVSCRDHMDLAIEQFLDEYEDAPDIYKLKETSFTAWTVPARCDFCDREPIYLIV
ncbi:MAG TPA: CxxH/CxxC protein [Bacillota bacterium]|nr:CxxH/CxxC protein [Bacillota bacterium]